MKRTLTLIGFLSLFCLATALAALGPTKYTVLLAGNRAGTQVSQKTSNNEWQFEFEFNDRGRGPKLSTQVVLGPDSIPILIETKGNDYLKAPVEERFELKDSKATWKSPSEKGEKSVAGGAFYITSNSAPEEMALLARALLAVPEKKIALLPEGNASIEKGKELQVTANGKTKKVVLYSISGLSFTPNFIWLEEDGAYFASSSSWFSVVQEGWESVLPELSKIQDALIAIQNKQMAKTLGHKPSGALVIENGNVFDATTGKILPEATVLISGNRIQSVGPKFKMPEGTEVIDATGKTVMPGLWDMHVHLSDVDGPLNIAAGVTTVRDLANDTDFVMNLRNQFDRGEAIGPRVILAGFVDGSGPYAGPTKVLVDNEEQIRAAIDNYAKLGYVQIKVYSSIKPELVPFIISEAHKHGMRVSGHIPANMTAEQCVKLGFDEIQHVNFLILNFFPEIKDTRTPLRFTAVAENAAGLDLNSERVQNFIQLLKEHHTVLDPTVNVFESLFTDRPGTISATVAAIADRLPAQVRRGYLNGGLPVPEGKDELYRQSFQATKRFVGMLYNAGIQIVAGTDSLAGFTLQRELELYVDSGIPPADVLRLATLGAAKVMKHDQELGSVERGKLADIMIVDGNPVSRIGDIRKVTTVIKDGVVYQSGEIYKAIGVKD
jgi:Amidohydrolase family